MLAVEEGWQRRVPHLVLDQAALERLLGVPLLEAHLLEGGLRNTNYRVRVRGEARPLVLRLYTSDPSACLREVALARRVSNSVPVPRALSLDASASPPWAVFEWLDGERFDRLVTHASPPEIEQVCRAAGEVLAAIHTFTFGGPGFLGPELEIREPMGYSWLTGVRAFFGSELARQRVGARLAQQVADLTEREAWRLDAAWGQAHLVHADYKPWNLLVRRTRSGWSISAVLDWEFSFSGPPLCDLGIFLRYAEQMPQTYLSGFLDGYRAAGGALPPDARNLARLIDLVSLWTFLALTPLDPAIVRDVRPLLVRTVRAFSLP